MTWILLGVVVGGVLWWGVVRPMQLDNHERNRRRYNLPPQRRLPEDDDDYEIRRNGGWRVR